MQSHPGEICFSVQMFLGSKIIRLRTILFFLVQDISQLLAKLLDR